MTGILAKHPPLVGFPQNELNQMGLYEVSDTVGYATTDGTVLFTLPAYTELVAVRVEPTTAWGDLSQLNITDSSANVLMHVGPIQLGQVSTPCSQLIGKKFETQADLRVYPLEGGHPAAGAAEVSIIYRPYSNKKAPFAEK